MKWTDWVVCSAMVAFALGLILGYVAVAVIG